MTSEVTYRRSSPGPRKSRSTSPGFAWSLLDALLVAAMLAATMIGKELVLASAPVRVMPEQGRIVVRAATLAIFYVAQVAVLFALARRKGSAPVLAFRLRSGVDLRAVLGSSALVAALLLGTRAFSTAWGAFAHAIRWAPPDTGTISDVFGSGGTGLTLAIALVVFLAPFAEELAFRGVITPALVGRIGRWPAILVSGAVFSLYHLTVWVAAPTFVLGCALGWLALSRRTLWPAVLLHALYNGVVVAAAFAIRG